MYFILGPRSDSDAPTYWSMDNEWVENIYKADPFPIDILTVPLPRGSVGVMPFTKEMEPEGFYQTLP